MQTCTHISCVLFTHAHICYYCHTTATTLILHICTIASPPPPTPSLEWGPPRPSKLPWMSPITYTGLSSCSRMGSESCAGEAGRGGCPPTSCGGPPARLNLKAGPTPCRGCTPWRLDPDTRESLIAWALGQGPVGTRSTGGPEKGSISADFKPQPHGHNTAPLQPQGLCPPACPGTPGHPNHRVGQIQPPLQFI